MARDDEYAICPYCGEKHGDCWEWLTSEVPQKVECQGCGRTFMAWAEHSVDYVTTTSAVLSSDTSSG